MEYDPRKLCTDTLPGAFVDSLESYILGVISIEQIRRRIGTLLAEDRRWGEDMMTAVDRSFELGYLNRTAYQTLITEIDLGTSEDEPTEWSEETRADAEKLGGEAPPGTEPPPTLTHAVTTTAVTETSDVPSAGSLLAQRYRLIEQIGTGNMGEVYKAVDETQRTAGEPSFVAVKVVSQPHTTQRGALHALRNEAECGQALDHANVVRVLDFDCDGDAFYLAMEWLDGESLAALLDRRRFAPMMPADAWPVIAALCDALEHAHARGITHADVKPGNLFITRDRQVKLLDFGVARRDAGRHPNFDAAALGARTPGYASCEVCEGLPAEPADDVYSVACVAYRLLAGHRVRGGATAIDALRQGLRPARIDTLDDPQWQALEQALAFRRAARTPDIASFKAQFFESSRPAGSLATEMKSTTVQPAHTDTAPPRSPDGAPDPAPAIAEIDMEIPGVTDTWLNRLPLSPLRFALAVVIAGSAAAGWWLYGEMSPAPMPGPAPVAATQSAVTPAATPAKDNAHSEEPRQADGPGTAARARRPNDEGRTDDGAAGHAGSSPEPAGARAILAETQTPRGPADAGDGPVPAQAPGGMRARTAQADAETDADATLALHNASASQAAASERYGQLLEIASQRMDDGHLTEPAADSAAHYVAMLETIAPDSPEVEQARTRLANLMLLEAMVAINDEHFEMAENWIAATRDLGVPAEMSARYEDQLVRARAAKATRDNEALGTIFASITPAAILAGGDLDDPPPAIPAAATGTGTGTGQPNTLAMVLPDPQPADTPPDNGPVPASANGNAPAANGPDTAEPGLVPLSALTFRRFVEPRLPLAFNSHTREGWVEVRFRVDHSGHTDDVRIVAAEPEGVFDQAALKAVRRWRFEPHRVDGQVHSANSGVRLRFEE